MKALLTLTLLFSATLLFGQDFIEGTWESTDENRISQSFVFNGDNTGTYLRGKSTFPIYEYSLKKRGDHYIIDYVMGTEFDKTPMFSTVEKVSETQMILTIYMDKEERDSMLGKTSERPITLSKTN